MQKSYLALSAALLLMAFASKAQVLETDGPSNGLGGYGAPIHHYPVDARAYVHKKVVKRVRTITRCDVEHYQASAFGFTWVKTDLNTTSCRASGNWYYRRVPTNYRHERVEKFATQSTSID